MRFHALATDYDGTLAVHGRVEPAVRAALERLRASGRKAILVTGRELEELRSVFPELRLFDRIVAENGAHLFRPDTREDRVLGPPPPEALLAALRRRNVPFERGKVIVATREPHGEAVLEAVRELGLEHQLIFNKGAVMVLPPGINKAQGLAAALDDLGLSPRNVAAIGDAENDNALLESCECGVAVADALPGLKARADLVTRGGAGAGVIELIARLTEGDLQDVELVRRGAPLGRDPSGNPVKTDGRARAVLLAGTSGGGKTTFATAFLEGLRDGGYQFCVLDPEGDYVNLEHAVVLGDARHAPLADEAAQVLAHPGESLVLCTLGVPFSDRPQFFQTLLPGLLDLRSRTGRPHWIIVDEAHHLIPAQRGGAPQSLPQELSGFFFITLDPSHVHRAVLEQVDWVLAAGEDPEATLADFAAAAGRPAPKRSGIGTLPKGEALAWRPAAGAPPLRLRCDPPRSERRRHVRKYSTGDLGPEESFRFRGPEGKLNLRAQNLMLFLQIAEGVDDATWMHHLRRKDYSRWFRSAIKDEEMAAEAGRVEDDAGLTAEESRALIRQSIERRYTGPA
jgi:hydroxymethylpyrimidine pyrophosphatase-like HAD family hydrolase